jgi:hypothetical protein
MEAMRKQKILVGKPEGTRPPGRRVCKWEDNIRTDLIETTCDDVKD